MFTELGQAAAIFGVGFIVGSLSAVYSVIWAMRRNRKLGTCGCGEIRDADRCRCYRCREKK